MNLLTEIPTYAKSDVVTGCCPMFHPEQWDGKGFDFSKMSFIKAPMRSFLHIPLNLGKVMTKAQHAINQAGQGWTDRYLILSEDVTPFKTYHYFYTSGSVPGFASETIEGKWIAKVFDGPFQDAPKWFKVMEQTGTYQRMFMFYTTCPSCAKTYGHNYVVLFGQVE